MTTNSNKILLDIEQCTKYGYPLPTSVAIAALAKIRAADELAKTAKATPWRLRWNELEDKVEAYERAGVE